jgi:hypothetical protein
VLLPLVLISSILVISSQIMAYNSQTIQPLGYRPTPPPNLSPPNIEITIRILSIDPAAKTVHFNASIFERLPSLESSTFQNARISSGFGNFHREYHLIKSGNGFGSAVNFQSNQTDRGPNVDNASAYPQRYPYDIYILHEQAQFGSFDPGIFPSDFIPEILVYAPVGWQVSVSESSQNGAFVNPDFYISISRLPVNSFLYFLPPLAIYFALGMSLFIEGSLDWEQKRGALQLRLMINLALITATFPLLTFLASDVPRNCPPSFLQASYAALLLGNILFIGVSIRDVFGRNARVRGLSLWGYAGLVSVSILPVLFAVGYSYLGILSYSSELHGYSWPSLLYYGSYALDFRILLWFTLFFGVLWLKFYQQILPGLSLVLSGGGVLVMLHLSQFPDVDLGLSLISILFVLVGLGLLFNDLLKNLRFKKQGVMDLLLRQGIS